MERTNACAGQEAGAKVEQPSGGANKVPDAGFVKLAPMELFDELPIERKIERIRRSLQVLAEQQMVIGPIAIGARNLVQDHGHGPTGVMKPVGGNGYFEQGFSGSPVKAVLDLLR